MDSLADAIRRHSVLVRYTCVRATSFRENLPPLKKKVAANYGLPACYPGFTLDDIR